MEDNKIINKDEDICNLFDDYYVNIVAHIGQDEVVEPPKPEIHIAEIKNFVSKNNENILSPSKKQHHLMYKEN